MTQKQKMRKINSNESNFGTSQSAFPTSEAAANEQTCPNNSPNNTTINANQEQQMTTNSTCLNATSSKLSINNLLCTPQDIKRIIFNDLSEYLKSLPADSPSITYRQLLEFLVKLHKDIPMEIREDIHFFLEEQLALREQKMRLLQEAHDQQQLEENPQIFNNHSKNTCQSNSGPKDRKRAI